MEKFEQQFEDLDVRQSVSVSSGFGKLPTMTFHRLQGCHVVVVIIVIGANG